MRTIKKSLSAVLLFGLVTLSWGGNIGAMFQSLLVPGMGQIGGGGGHTYIGIGFMAAEVMALHSVFNAMSEASTHARETRLYQREYEDAQAYSDQIEIRLKWDEAYANHGKREDDMMMWAAVAGGVWVVNVLEALLLVPAKEIEEEKEEEEMDEEEGAGKWSPPIPSLAMNLHRKEIGLRITKGF